VKIKPKKKPHPQSLREARYIANQLNARADLDRENRLDADETSMLALQLEHLRMQVVEQKFHKLRARQVLPTGGNDIDNEAAIVENYGDDPPMIEESQVKIPAGIVGFWVGYMFTVQDLRRAARVGRPLSANKVIKARRAFERLLDEVAAIGRPARGIPSGITNKTVGTAAGNIRGTAVADATKWQDATRDADDMLADLNKLVREYSVDNDDNFEGRTLVLPVTHEIAVRQTRMSTLTDTTVLQAFLAANPMIQRVIPWRKMAGIDSSGTLDRGLLIQDTVDVAELILPQDFELFPLEQRGLSFRGIAHGRTGGTDVHEPLGCRYLTGLPNTL
jgi:hypothetical protein